MLWKIAPQMLNIKYEMRCFNSFLKRNIIKTDSNPPPKLKLADKKPRCIRTKDDFRNASKNADGPFKKNKAYITAILDKPNFSGTGAGMGGKKLSSQDKTRAKANNIAKKTS